LCIANPNGLRLLLHCIRRAASRAAWTAGTVRYIAVSSSPITVAATVIENGVGLAKHAYDFDSQDCG
jgi:hypothetical protein